MTYYSYNSESIKN